MEKNIGTVVQVIGPVLDIRFGDGRLPSLLTAIEIENEGRKVVAEVDWYDATGMSDVSLESVIGWDPEVIVTWDSEIRGGAEDIIRTSKDWAVIKAVRNGRVYAMPNIPVAWVDRPMACNRFLGVQWLANMFYPDRFDVNMVEVGKEYYKLFFGCDVTDDEMKGFLGASYPPYKNV